ncbi:hypothetical protein KK141_02405 [Dyella sp. LX-66]|uniref:hypothetical protein n=1 Tax=unclassified Dyella TaxID=2634549 RepID=UPI001BE00F21|nr:MULTISPECIES: hypothetical protein [unclassified Dyella]MBT2117319.1 hypothetical protein [Dyella sp. LX-1]MBT2138383.1 hypothetical protein [Dyella sp. LX-66]
MALSLTKPLIALSLVSNALLMVLLLTGFASQRATKFDEITVHRINVVEPDGTLRMVISNKKDLPGVIIKGKEQPPSDRPQAGMIFYNDEGTENGGLIFGGHKDASGNVVDSGGSLSFDKYGANQIVQLAGVDDKTDKFAGLAVSDDHRRVWVGRTEEGDSMLSLMDATGHKRIVLRVAPDGHSSMEFLDAEGKVVKSMSPDSM